MEGEPTAVDHLAADKSLAPLATLSLPQPNQTSYNIALKSCLIRDLPEVGWAIAVRHSPQDAFGRLTMLTLCGRHGWTDLALSLRAEALANHDGTCPALLTQHVLQAFVAVTHQRGLHDFLNSINTHEVSSPSTHLLLSLAARAAGSATGELAEKLAKDERQGSGRGRAGANHGDSDSEEDLHESGIISVGVVDRRARNARYSRRLREQRLRELKALHSRKLKVVVVKGSRGGRVRRNE